MSADGRQRAPAVGRGARLEALTADLAGAVAGHGALRLIAGEAGTEVAGSRGARTGASRGPVGGAGRLSDRQRSLMLMLADESAPSYAEIATRLGIPLGSLGPTRARCIERLPRDPELAAVAD